MSSYQEPILGLVNRKAPSINIQLNIDNLLAGLVVQVQKVVIEEDIQPAIKRIGSAVLNQDIGGGEGYPRVSRP